MDFSHYANLCKEIYSLDNLEIGFHHYYSQSENTIVVCGSNAPNDWWLYNLRPFPLRPFHNGYQGLAEDYINYYGGLINEDTVITGHSAGGYIAFVMACMSGCTSISFGSPLIFTKKARLGKEHFFFSFQNDLVSRLVWYPKQNSRLIRSHFIKPKGGHKMENYVKILKFINF